MSREGGRAPENRENRRSFKHEIAARLDALRCGPFDVLILHLPREVIENREWMAEAQQGAVEVMEAARRPVVLLPEGTKLTAEDVTPFLREMGFKVPERKSPAHLPFEKTEIVLPEKRIIRPQDN
jgi:1-acyl-sn-glycerol-3-phosphate acyltransferase